MAKLLAVFKPVNWPSWIFLSWRAIDTWGNIEFLRGKMDALSAFIKSPWAVGLALGWLFIVALGGHTKLFSLITRRNVPQPTPEKQVPLRTVDVLIAEDTVRLSNLVWAEVKDFRWEGIGKAQPFFEFYVHVENTSLVVVQIIGSDGYLQIWDEQCGTPRIERTRIDMRSAAQILVHQPVSSQLSDLITLVGHHYGNMLAGGEADSPKNKVQFQLTEFKLLLQAEGSANPIAIRLREPRFALSPQLPILHTEASSL